MIFYELGLGSAQRESETCAGNDWPAILGSLAGRAGENVPVPVDHGEVRGSAAADAGSCPPESVATRGDCGAPSTVALPFRGSPAGGVPGQARSGSISAAALGQVRRRQHFVHGYVYEIGIAHVLLAVGESQVQGLADRVDVLRRSCGPWTPGRTPRGS